MLQDTYDGTAKIWYIDRYHHRKLMKEMGEINMGDYKTLRDFINYCKQNFPAWDREWKKWSTISADISPKRRWRKDRFELK